MTCRWSIAEPAHELRTNLAREFGFSPLLAQCLINRGYDTRETVSAFTQPRLKDLSDPFLIPQMDVAVDRLFRALQTREPFVIFGDYDVDGATATALLCRFFGKAGFHCDHYLPSRFGE